LCVKAGKVTNGRHVLVDDAKITGHNEAAWRRDATPCGMVKTACGVPRLIILRAVASSSPVVDERGVRQLE